MLIRAAGNRVAWMLFCVGWLFATPLSLQAEMTAIPPLGRLATSGTISIGNVLAPTGTVLFSGDRLSAQDSPALVNFNSGSSVVLARGAAATISRKGKTLLVQAERGTIGFHFVPREIARIEAGHYKFTASAKSGEGVGELVIGTEGQVAMSLSSGSLSAFNTASGESFEVSADSQAKSESLAAANGILVNDTNTFSDPTQHWTENSLSDKCIVVRGEAHRIVANKAATLTLRGTWLLFSGTYEYTIAACTEQALANAEAAIGVEEALEASAAVVPPVPSPSPGMSAGAKVAIFAGVAGGAAAGIALAASNKSKSP
jgi:hypothetical protein